MASSAVDARMLVCFFSFVTFTSMSSRARVLADDHAFVDRRSGLEEDLAALLEVVDRVGRRDARSIGHQCARQPGWNRADTTGCHLWKRWFMIPVPRVSVRNCDRNPMSPRVGTRNSMRTRPLPWLTILDMIPLRVPIWAMIDALILLR